MASTDSITDSITTWNNMRLKNLEEIKNLFTNTGNHFSLSLGNTSICSHKLHVYFAYSDGALQFYAIPSDSDERNKERPVEDLALFSIPLSTQMTKILSENPADEKYIDWINNWCNDSIRNNWLDNVSKNGNVIQAFVINTADFMMNTTHKCYLALRPTSENENIYMIDLVVENTKTNDILNAGSGETEGGIEPQFRDMARPVPPFGQEGHLSTEATNFGLLGSLGIN
ncbi:hypothetical protein IMCC3317_39940 [Kordia antarctica]|uniref:Uncharacterized protein n=1 Tax=Kordia antarctica TaxID=1218801 RepID=A0A7L4ZQ15_9FLAO|nr:hypothetical protein [Kordia antarctica]QHI38600.1 hypothetical protein IMCC3317_39940 [Kordia antarctica]